jgi:DNA modification methylase
MPIWRPRGCRVAVKRVVEADWSELTPDDDNANLGTQRGMGLLEESLRSAGAGRSIVVDRNGKIIGGNKTAEKAMELGIPVTVVETDGTTLIAVKRIDLDLDDPNSPARELALADNRVGQVNLAWAAEALERTREKAEKYWFPEELDVMGVGHPDPFGHITGDGALLPSPHGEEAPEVEVDDAALDDEAAVTQPGDVIQLGTHRLVCGDATMLASWEALFFGEADRGAQMVLTDPPYGVDVAAKNRFLDRLQRGNSNRVTEDMDGDDQENTGGLEEMLHASFAYLLARTDPGAPWYVFGPSGDNLWRFSKALSDIGVLRQTIAWVKNNATFAPLGVDYHWRWEPIFYGWSPGAAHSFYGDRTHDTLWEFDRPHKSPEHPTMKPVALMAHAVTLSSAAGDLILDPFCGAGASLMAAEQEGRVCYAMELRPAYCDVIVKRWEQYTGQEAIRP